MDSCSVCKGKGFLQSHHAKDNQMKPMLVKCPNPNCPHTENYYEHVRNKYSLDRELPEDQPRPQAGGFVDKAPDNYKSSIGQRPPISQELLNRIPEGMTINVPEQIMNNPEKLEAYVRDAIDSYNNYSRPIPEKLERKENPNNLKMSEEFPNLPQVLVEQAKQNIEANPEAGIVLKTPFGPYPTRSLQDANRIMGILKDYWNSEKELEIADKTENVIIFPLGRSFGLE